MPKVYLLSEVDALDGDERIYVTDDPTGTPADGYVTVDTLEEHFSYSVDNGHTAASVGATHALTLTPIQYVILGENCTVTLPAPTSAGQVFAVNVIGVFTLTWAGPRTWPGGTEPTYGGTGGGSWYVFTSNRAGTSWAGAMYGGAGGFA